MRAMALSNKLQNNEVIPFWKEFKSLRVVVVEWLSASLARQQCVAPTVSSNTGQCSIDFH